MSDRKSQLAKLCARSGWNAVTRRAQRALMGRHVRAVNYHDVPAAHAASFEAQLQWLALRFSNVDLPELEAVLSGTSTAEGAGLLISFDDGLRTAVDVAAPLLEKHGFTGWFMVPVGFIDCPAEHQVDYARDHQILFSDAPADGRIAMTWSELRALSERHVVTCHGMTHRRLGPSLSTDEFEHEIRDAKELLEKRLGADVHGFTWVGGEEDSYSAEGARVVREAGYRFAFMTNNLPITARSDPFQLQRTNLEAWFPLELIDFQLSGMMDAYYTPKRWRVNRLTA